MQRRFALATLASLASLVWLSLSSPPALAQEAWPSRPIRFIVPWPPGGAADMIARLLSERLTVALGQPVQVDNRAGAGGIVGTEVAATSPADGYTLLFGSTGPNAINRSLYAKLPYDPITSFTAVTQLTALPLVVVAGPTLEAKSIEELIALARARPGKLTVASVGAGTAQHLAGEIFRAQAGIDWVHVAYKGSAPAFTDLIGGEVNLLFDNIPASKPHLDGGKVRALAVTSATRSASLPELMTVGEAGLPGFEAVAWQNVLVPAGTPRPVVDRLNVEIVRILKDPEVSARLTGMGAIVVGSSVDEAAAHVRSEVGKWGQAVKAAGVKLD